jgi:hypothetical protein
MVYGKVKISISGDVHYWHEASRPITRAAEPLKFLFLFWLRMRHLDKRQYKRRQRGEGLFPSIGP